MVNFAVEGVKWAARLGDVSKLAQWLREDRPVGKADKEFIADLLEGKIKPPKRRRGRPYRPLSAPTLPEMVAAKYYNIADWLRRRRQLYGKAPKLIEMLATKYGVDPNTLANEINRGREYRFLRATQKANRN